MVVELARALARKTHQMYLKGTFSTDESSQATLEMEKDYKQHDIHLTSDEISSPSVNNFVALLDYNVRDASLLLSLIKMIILKLILVYQKQRWKYLQVI